MVFYAASYYPRYGDPIGTAVALCRSQIIGADGSGSKVEEAVEKAAEHEREEWPSYCDDTDCDGSCSLCCPDIIAGGAFTYRAKDLFTARELAENRRALMAGEVVWLYS